MALRSVGRGAHRRPSYGNGCNPQLTQFLREDRSHVGDLLGNESAEVGNDGFGDGLRAFRAHRVTGSDLGHELGDCTQTRVTA